MKGVSRSAFRVPRSALRVVKLTLVFVAIAPTLAASQLIDRVMAVVSGAIITLSDVGAAIELGLVDATGTADPTGAALTRLIERELVLEEVNRLATEEPDPAEIDRRLTAIRRRYPTAEAFARTLQRYGIAEGHLRDLIRDNLRIETYQGQRFDAAARATEAEVEQYYREHEPEFVRGGQQIPQLEALDLARARLQEQRRRALIQDWVARLRRRANVIDVYFAPGRSPS